MITCIKVLDDGTAIEVAVPDEGTEIAVVGAAPDPQPTSPKFACTDGGLTIREEALADAASADIRHSAQGPEARVRAVLEAVFGKVEVRP